MKRFFFLPFFFLATLMMCSKTTKEPVKLTLNIVAEPSTLDTRKIRILADTNVANMIYEGLFRSTNSGPILALAESYTVDESETIYRFKIRKSSWSNGAAITANDFVKTYQSTLSPDFPSDYANLLYYIKGAEEIKLGKQSIETLGVKAIDPTTIEFELEHPIPYFLDLLCLPIYYPLPEGNSVYSGPFILSKWQHSYQITLMKNPFYWDKEAVKLDRVDLLMCESETGLQMFEKGQLDLEGDPFSKIPPDNFEHLANTGALLQQPVMATHWIRVNTSRDDLKNKFFRQAIATSIHRKDLSEHVLYNFKVPTLRICPFSTAPCAYEDGSRETAKELIFAHPQSRPYVLSYKSTPINHRMAQAIQSQLERVGIEITLERLEPKVFFSRLSKIDFDLALGAWVADVPDSINFLQNFRTSDTGTNSTHWENLRYKELLDAAIQLKGADRATALKEAEAILLEESPVIPLLQETMLYVKNPRLKGVHISNLGLLNIKGAYFSDED
ncbi:MAG: peptide ABC transporter substrate-binding protein [Chlamydiia bacterium]